MSGPTIFQQRYVVLSDEKVRHSGMSAMYPCIDSRGGGRKVAVKVIEPNGDIDRLEETIFEREVDVRNLTHSNIVTLHDSGRLADTGQFFLLLDWIDYDLRDWILQRRPVGTDDFVDQMAQALSAWPATSSGSMRSTPKFSLPERSAGSSTSGAGSWTHAVGRSPIKSST